MKPEHDQSVEHAWPKPNLNDMNESDISAETVVAEDGSQWIFVVDPQPLTFSNAFSPAFVTAFVQGMGGPTMLYSTLETYPEFSAPTIAQCFGMVGATLNEMVPVEINVGRAKTGKKREAA